MIADNDVRLSREFVPQARGENFAMIKTEISELRPGLVEHAARGFVAVDFCNGFDGHWGPTSSGTNWATGPARLFPN